MRSLRRATALLAALSLIVSTMAGAAMTCEPARGGAAAPDAMAEGAIRGHGAHAAAANAQGHHLAMHSASLGEATDISGHPQQVPAPQGPHRADCPAMGPCAFVLLAVAASARPLLLPPLAMARATSELAPSSRTLVPDLPPPRA